VAARAAAAAAFVPVRHPPRRRPSQARDAAGAAEAVWPSRQQRRQVVHAVVQAATQAMAARVGVHTSGVEQAQAQAKAGRQQEVQWVQGVAALLALSRHQRRRRP